MAALNVAIVNDYPVVVNGLDAMLAPFSDRVKVAELGVRDGPSEPVDVTLCDTFAAAQRLNETIDDIIANPRAGRVLLYSWNLRAEDVRDALERGCVGYVDKAASAEELVAAIEQAATGEHPVHRGRSAMAGGQGWWPGQEADLSPREAEMIALITQGLTNHDIGERLNLSINTVKTYIRSAYLKTGVSRRSQAVKWGIEHGLVPGGGDEAR